MRISLLVGLFLIAVPLVKAQDAAAPALCATSTRASFDVVSIRPSMTTRRGSSFRATADGFTSTGPLRRLVLNAYGLRDFQLEGGPGWMNDAIWEVAGRIDPPDADPSKLDQAGLKAWKDQRSLKLQALLMDRFQLKCHVEHKVLPVYELVIAKNGAKLVDTKEPVRRNAIDGEDEGQRMQTIGRGVDMTHLAAELTGDLGRIVVDKTGLTGNYDFVLNWAAENMSGSAGSDGNAPGGSLFTALQEQMGLKLVATKGPVPVLVIDGVERPSEN
jgi:uncharacterized protein (TIGR03435 family)